MEVMMEDEVSTSPLPWSPLATKGMPCINDDRENYSPAPGAKSKKLTLTLSSGDEVRKPFRKVGSSSSSGNTKKMPLQKQQRSSSGGVRRIKCVLIGDSKTGKSALVRSFVQGQSISDYVPTTQDEHIHNVSSSNQQGNGLSSRANNADRENERHDDKEVKDKKSISLHICDTGGQEEMDRLRPLCYSQARMVVICFSVMDPNSFANVTVKWLPEVKRHCMVTEDPENPLKLLLVGTQSDLRSNVNMLLKLMDDGQAPISEIQAVRLANKIGALKYVESSTVSGSNVNHVFQLAATYGHGKVMPKQVTGFEMDTGFKTKFLPNLTESKLLFWRRWRIRQNKLSKMKRLVLLPCLF